MKRFLKSLAVLSVFAVAPAMASAEWKEVRQRDLYWVVIVDRSDIGRTAVFWEALRTVCSGKRFCNVVVFSSDDSGVATDPKRFSDDELKKALLIYSSSTGFAWNCQYRPEADNCFKP
jgi:hypothetical protein